jgi:hypothetical protein
MASLRVWISSGSIAWILLLLAATVCQAQTPGSPAAGAVPDPGPVGTNTALVGPWEFTFDGRIGAPTGRLQVGESKAGEVAPGTLLRPRTLGIDVSGAVEGSAAFHATPKDAVRASLLYYFLRGSTTVTGPSVVFDGTEFKQGSLDTKADFFRVSLAYERTLYSRPSGEQLIGSLGLTYVYFNPTLTGNHGNSVNENFYAQELPVPILGLRWDLPLGPHWLLRATVSGGGLPRVDSLRQEGGTVYLQQSHADAGIGLAYVFGPHTQLDIGYHFTYFFQHETSHEDNNLFELIDNSAQVRFTVRF